MSAAINKDEFLCKYENHICVTKERGYSRTFTLTHENIKELPEYEDIISFAKRYSNAKEKIEITENSISFCATGTNITFLQFAVDLVSANIKGDLFPSSKYLSA